MGSHKIRNNGFLDGSEKRFVIVNRFGSQTLPVWAGRVGRGKGLMNNWTLMWIHGCIPAVSVDEGKRECQVGVSRE